MSLLSGAVQPPLLTLLSSTSTPPLSLFAVSTHDQHLDGDSIVTVLLDSAPASSSRVPHRPARGQLVDQVIHIQSPVITNTYIEAGVSPSASQARKGKSRASDEDMQMPLGVEMPWFGMQFRRLGKRPFAFELGVADKKGREGVIRISSFKHRPTIHPSRTPPLIHLPLNLPDATSSTLTPWLTTSMDLASLLPLFQTLLKVRLEEEEEDEEEGRRRKRRKAAELPSGQFGHVTYVRIYANCRLRRIWLSAEGERTTSGMGIGVQQEWGLYACSTET
ncbi:hypothetical protein P7C73_g5981, partial [Tremellales sp. Uapishka_1]